MFSSDATHVKDAKGNLPKLKGSLTTPSVIKEPPKRRRRGQDGFDAKYDWLDEDDEEEDEEDDEKRPYKRFDVALRRLHRSLNVEQRLSHLEARMEAVQRHKAAARHSNNMLGMILSELRRINRSFEEQKKNEERNKLAEETQRQQHVNDDNGVPEIDVDLALKEERMILNPVDEETPIVDEAACRQAILNMQSISEFEFMKAPKVDMVGTNEGNGIIIVEGL